MQRFPQRYWRLRPVGRTAAQQKRSYVTASRCATSLRSVGPDSFCIPQCRSFRPFHLHIPSSFCHCLSGHVNSKSPLDVSSPLWYTYNSAGVNVQIKTQVSYDVFYYYTHDMFRPWHWVIFRSQDTCLGTLYSVIYKIRYNKLVSHFINHTV